MAGGKETPRQKMIGMMYLVLTALLALNVSKTIVAAFITLNDKLDSSGRIIENSTNAAVYNEFDKKLVTAKTTGGNVEEIQRWQNKSINLENRTKQIVHFILSQSNEMIEDVEGVSWIKEKDDDGYIIKLKSLMKVEDMVNYDVPTHLFIGGNPMKPNKKGLAILDSIHSYRDNICKIMATYEFGDKKFSFTPPEDISGLKEALKAANPKDTAKVAQFYRSMTIPDKLKVKDGGNTKMMPWPSAMFDHSPVVAAAAMFTALKVDVLNAESLAGEYLINKVDAPTFNFNKIEPLAFARTGYINPGDSLDLRVMIAAYDSNEVPPIRYGINDSVPSNWEETKGTIKLKGTTSGKFKITGQIGVKERGERKWRDWTFNYTVGSPSGAVSLPEMNVLYRGYDNRVVGAVSGFQDYSLSGAGNVSISQSGEEYIASPGRGRNATINLNGISEDGSSSSLGSFEFRVQNLPKPSISLGRIKDGEDATSTKMRASRRLFAGYPPEIPLDAEFGVVSWQLSVSGAPRPIQGNGSSLNGKALRMIANGSSGGMVTVVTKYREPGGGIRRQNAVYNIK
jgi:hypothetical protein